MFSLLFLIPSVIWLVLIARECFGLARAPAAGGDAFAEALGPRDAASSLVESLHDAD